ncbi:MAG: S-layer homology domain-containing protein [Clostridiales bacterium]
MSKKLIGLSFALCVICFSCFVAPTGASATEFGDTNHWAKNSIDYVSTQGWFTGTSDTTFSPDGDMTRAMFVTVLARFANADTASSSASDFADVSSTEYYASSVSWANTNGIVFGTSDKTFSPNEDISRDEAATILSRFVKESGRSLALKNNVSVYKDDKTISSWAYDSVYEMQKYGIIVGDTNNYFKPQQNFTRAEASVVFSRLNGEFLENYEVVVETPAPPIENVETPTGPTGKLIGTYKSTFYCPGSCCNGSWAGKTALGVTPTPGRTIAVDPSRIKLGTYVYLEFKDARLAQYNGEYRAEDTGGAIKGSRIDVLLGSHSACNSAGVGSVNIYVQ